ncbi:hypothetical protein [uncultured Pontibacter sp.]|uniref:hypothetical protein n=1 Tax=uncultured Pontibacter sp. TaxID=453356 RepID=UPI00261C719B|nr:hypothetical protein [uncultured Pontibacter sp.]
MKQLIRLFYGITLFLSFACDYNPSGSHYEEISPSTEVTAEITLNQYQDTIRVRGNVMLNFQVSLPGRIVHGYQLKFNNTILSQGSAFSGSHFFETKSYRDGFYTMQLSAIGNSGTGSLADKHGAESIEVYRTWVVQVDNTLPQPVNITSIKPENGQLRIEWQKYKGTGFERYLIIRQSGNGFYSEYSGTITDPDKTF